MTASTATAKGILRSRPLYSSASDNGGAKKYDGAASSTSSSPSAVVDTVTATPTRLDGHDQRTGATGEMLGDGATAASIASSRNKSAMKGNAKSPRSLASLVKCSVDLSAEASGVADGERGSVVSHKPSSDGTEDANKKFMEGEPMSTLLISEEGTPYLKSNLSSGPEVVDSNDVIAIGVMGEDGQQVRFCEYDDDNDDGNDKAASARKRLEKRLENDYDDDYAKEEGGNINDFDSDSGGSLTHDEEILAELGLSELVLEEEEEEDLRKISEELSSFRVLWELLTRWTTPATIELVLHYQGRCSTESPQQESGSSSAIKSSTSQEEEKTSDNDDSSKRDAMDVGASRMASIMSMLKMNINRSMSELKKIHHKPETTHGGTEVIIDQRKVEQRLADLVRTFDPTAPAANLNMKMWRGMTTILIAMSFPSLSGGTEPVAPTLGKDVAMLLPPSLRSLNVSVDEYRYLTQSAIVSLSSTI